MMYRIKIENRNSGVHASRCKVCDENKEELDEELEKNDCRINF